MATKKAKKSAKKAKKTSAKKKGSTKKSDSNLVSLSQLADEAKVSGQKARQRLRAAEIERPDGGRWAWPAGSKELKAAKKAISGE